MIILPLLLSFSKSFPLYLKVYLLMSALNFEVFARFIIACNLKCNCQLAKKPMPSKRKTTTTIDFAELQTHHLTGFMFIQVSVSEPILCHHYVYVPIKCSFNATRFQRKFCFVICILLSNPSVCHICTHLNYHLQAVIHLWPIAF